MRSERDTELLRRLDDRDVRGAAALLIEEHADAVVGLCRAMVRDPTLAEDLSQDVFSRAFRALSSFRGEASTRTWILRIARNRCIDHLRAARRQPFVDADAPADEQPAAEPTVDDLLMRREDVKRGLDALGENERALVMLRFGHELGYGELAATFGLSEGAVRMRVSRAVEKMREALSTPVARRRRAASSRRARCGVERTGPLAPSPPPLASAPARAPVPGAPPPPSVPVPGQSPPAAAARARARLFGSGGGAPVPGAARSLFGSHASTRLRARLRALVDAI